MNGSPGFLAAKSSVYARTHFGPQDWIALDGPGNIAFDSSSPNMKTRDAKGNN